MLPKHAVLRVTAFAEPSDIRWRVLGYRAETDDYELQSVRSNHCHTVERVLLHAWLRCKHLTREKPTS